MENVIPDFFRALWHSGACFAFSLWATFMSLSQIAAARQGRLVASREAGAG
jgi:hypothetical protein